MLSQYVYAPVYAATRSLSLWLDGQAAAGERAHVRESGVRYGAGKMAAWAGWVADSWKGGRTIPLAHCAYQ